MRFFKLTMRKNIRDFTCDEDGWEYKFKHYAKFGLATLKTPILKEVTYSKGPTVRYVKHNIFCVGLIKDASLFYGIAFFDLPSRLFFEIFIFFICGIGSRWTISGFFVALLFYILLYICTASDDESRMSLIRRKLQ